MTMPGGLIGRALGAFGGQLPGRPMMNPAAAPGAGMTAAPGGSTITHTMQQMMPGAGMAPRGGTVPLRPPMGILGQAFGGMLGNGAPRPPAPIAQEGPGMMGQMMPGGPQGGGMAGGAPAAGGVGSLLQAIFAAKGGFPGQGGGPPMLGGAPTPPAAAAPPRPAAPKPGMAPGARPLPRGMSVNGRRTY
jgi:hypothetical protein